MTENASLWLAKHFLFGLDLLQHAIDLRMNQGFSVKE